SAVSSPTLEDSGQPGNLEKILDARLKVHEFQLTLSFSCGHVHTDQRTDAGTIDVAYGFEIKHNALGPRNERADSILQQARRRGRDPARSAYDGLSGILFRCELQFGCWNNWVCCHGDPLSCLRRSTLMIAFKRGECNFSGSSLVSERREDVPTIQPFKTKSSKS